MFIRVVVNGGIVITISSMLVTRFNSPKIIYLNSMQSTLPIMCQVYIRS